MKPCKCKVIIVFLAALVSAGSLKAGFEQDPAFEDFRKAKEMVFDEEYATAVTAFEAIVKKYGKSELLPEAYYQIAHCKKEMGKDDEKVFEAYKLVVDRYPKSGWANASRAEMVGIAKALYAQGNVKYKVYIEEFGREDNDDV